MTKAPRAGQVKTRLTPTLTPEEAAQLNTCFLRDMTSSISLAAGRSNASGFAVYTPKGVAEIYTDIIPSDFRLLPQRGEELGERIIFALEDIFQLGFSSVCLIGSDSPTIPPRVFTEAVALLEGPENTVVLGPTDDGGYYLVGLNRLRPSLFHDIDWSTARVLEQTCQRARQMDLEVHLLPAWYDVDDDVTLRRLCKELFAQKTEPDFGYPAPATRGYLDELLKKEGPERNRLCEPTA
jgi:rSAM/selenodomain-associated transferase 1